MKNEHDRNKFKCFKTTTNMKILQSPASKQFIRLGGKKNLTLLSTSDDNKNHSSISAHCRQGGKYKISISFHQFFPILHTHIERYGGVYFIILFQLIAS